MDRTNEIAYVSSCRAYDRVLQCIGALNRLSLQAPLLHSDISLTDLTALLYWLISHLSSHLTLNCEGRWGTTDDFATSFLHFPLFSTALWDFPNSRPVHSLMLSSHLFLCLPFLLPTFTVPCMMVLARPDERET